MQTSVLYKELINSCCIIDVVNLYAGFPGRFYNYGKYVYNSVSRGLTAYQALS
jgi:hypothetical protein